MDMSEVIAWVLLACALAGWWYDHRGKTGIKSDLEDARRELKTRLKR